MLILLSMAFIAGAIVGLYSGRKRAEGCGWGEILSGMFTGICSFFGRVFRRIKGLLARKPEEQDLNVSD